jgi:putative FmdB family regulatory protein
MPIYQYLCKTCNLIVVEHREVDNRDDETMCDNCNVAMKRLFSSPGVSFKGSGFYSTDK